MAVKAPSAAWAWLFWLLLVAGWIIMLAGAGALQESCAASDVSVIPPDPSRWSSLSGAAGYLAPISCGRFYSYAWWTVWYLFAVLIVIAVFLGSGWVHKWRMGLVGLMIPLVVLLQYTCDTFLGLWETGPVGGSQVARSKTLFAGSLISTISVYCLIILLGVFDEKAVAPAGVARP